ncbi:insecticidal delta-endotoxin Cry8Ea1 family protein [Bacillus cereus]|nr:insecticidal delta-endotoxin Cry8Ea1 family protein [Bacillus cereus]
MENKQVPIDSLGASAFAEAEVQEGQNQQKNENTDMKKTTENKPYQFWDPYKGITSNGLLNAFNTNIWKPLLSNLVKNQGTNVLPLLAKGAFQMAVTLAPPPLSLLAGLVDMFQPSTKNDDMWNQMVEYVNQTIDTKIGDYHQFLMSIDLQGFSKSLADHQALITAYEGTSDSKQKMTLEDQIIASFMDLNSSMNEKISKLQASEKPTDARYPVLVLPIFAQAANVHLALLRDTVVSDWAKNMDSVALQVYKDKLQDSIKEYTKYINETYKKGLEQEKAKEADYSNKDIYMQNSEKDIPLLRKNFNEVMKWNRVANYERQMSAAALDFAALLPTYNPDYYPTQPKVVQSRAIFAPIIGVPGGLKSMDKNKTYGSMVFDVKNFDQINTELDRVSREFKSYTGFLRSIYLYLSSTNNICASCTRTYENHPKHGSGGTIITIDINEGNPITSISGTSGFKPNTLSFAYADGTKSKTIGSNPSNTRAYGTFNFAYLGYQLSNMRVFGTSAATGEADAMVFGFRKLNLEKDAQQLISNNRVQIPAEMSVGTSSSIQEYINGQNAVEFNRFDSKERTYKINSPIAQEYKIRYRVAANEDSEISANNSLKTIISKTTDAANTIKGEYGYYKLVDGPTIKLNAGTNILSLTLTKGKFALDSIEFEPLSKDERIAFDNFDNERLSWKNIGGIIDGGSTGKAGKIGPNGDTWTYLKVVPYTYYTMNAKLKLNSDDPNARQKVKLFTDNAKGERVIKEVELKGRTGYQTFKLRFITNENLSNTHIGIQGTGGTYDILFDNVEIKGIKNISKELKVTYEKWDSYKSYRKGDKVEYQGKTYECIQDYLGDGNSDWIFSPSLWKPISNQ